MKMFLFVILLIFAIDRAYSADKNETKKPKTPSAKAEEKNSSDHDHDHAEEKDDHKDEEHKEDSKKNNEPAHPEGKHEVHDDHEDSKKANHDDHKEEKKSDHEKHEESEHSDHDDHDKKGEDGEHAEANPQVGPDKGILEASEENGIKLSSEAEKNFEIERAAVGQNGRITLSTKSIVTAGDEINVYRYRDSFYKRVDFVRLEQTGGQVSISSTELKVGDFVVTKGLGFLRIAEIAAFGGAPEGHSH